MKKQITRREKVLQTALKMISEGGFHGSPMSELAARSGVAVGTIYHHFPSKDELIEALHEECRQRVSVWVISASDPKLSIARRFASIWIALHGYLSKNPLEFSLLRQYESSPFLSEEDAGSAFFTAEVMEFFKEAVKSGKLRKLKPGMVASLFTGLVSAVVSEEFRTGKKLTGKELGELADMSWNALRK